MAPSWADVFGNSGQIGAGRSRNLACSPHTRQLTIVGLLRSPAGWFACIDAVRLSVADVQVPPLQLSTSQEMS
jgi:hypothetical protein